MITRRKLIGAGLSLIASPAIIVPRRALATGSSAVAFYRPNSTQDLWRCFSSTLAWTGYGEFKFIPLATGAMAIGGANANENYTTTTPLVQFASSASVWEYAIKIGVGGTSGPWDFFGNGHGNESLISRTITVDGTDVTGAASGFYLAGSTVQMTQNKNILLPSNNSVVCGTVQLRHTLTANGLVVESAFSPVDNPIPLYQWYNAYISMLPITPINATSGLNRIQFGSGPVETCLFPEVATTNDRGSQVGSFKATHSGHPYGINLVFPSGAPNITGSWASGTADCAFWVDEPGMAKIYPTDISTAFAERITAFPRSYAAVYSIFKS